MKEYRNRDLDEVWARMVWFSFVVMLFFGIATVIYYWPLFVRLFSLFLVLFGIWLLMMMGAVFLRFVAKTKAMCEAAGVPMQMAAKKVEALPAPKKWTHESEPQPLSNPEPDYKNYDHDVLANVFKQKYET